MRQFRRTQALLVASRLLGGVLVIGLTLFVGDRTWGQAQNIPRYTPATPTLSPYLGLLRNNRGALPNYFAFVRPIERQQQINQRAAVELQRQAVEIERAQEEFNQLEVQATGKGAWFYNYGTRNQFNQRSHFYGQWPQPRTVNRR